jgi:hypothetical protein
MSTFSKTFALGLFLLVNACGASAVTASTHGERAHGFAGGFGPVDGARTPPNVEQPMFDRQDANRDSNLVRENPAFRMDQDCWRCR